MKFSGLLSVVLLSLANADSDTTFFSPPVYPAPIGGTDSAWAEAYQKAAELVSTMSVMEMVNMTTGIGWQQGIEGYGGCVGNTALIEGKFPALCLQDSPTGVRFADYVSVFPAGISTAQTWSRGLFYSRAQALAVESKAKGVNVLLGPAIGPIGRNPRGGRNWEGFGSDPYLQGVAAELSITAIEAEGVQATIKHLVAQEQEHFRQAPEAQTYGYNITESLSSNIDDRTMHELYLWPFANAIKSGVSSIMCSYQQTNNSYSCQNSKLLNGLVKDELGFQGYIMSDWGAQHAGVATALAGLDMTMPGDGATFSDGYSYFGGNLTMGIVNGSIPIERLQDMAMRIAAAWYKSGQDKNYTSVNFNSWTEETYGYVNFVEEVGYGLINEHVVVFDQHMDLNREIATEGHVLVKNTGALPIKHPKSLGIFGSDAGPTTPLGPNGCADRGCDNGTLAIGWGSGTAQFPFLVTPLEGIQQQAVSKGISVDFILDDHAEDAILKLARYSDQCIVFGSSDSGEGYINFDGNYGDRNNMTLWRNGDAVVQQVASECNNTVVVIHSVGPVIVDEWIEHPNITAVIFAGLPGEQSGNAIADILFGVANPSGKLVYTVAKNQSDYKVDVLYEPNGPVPQSTFSEGLFIDYRQFDKDGIVPRFEFGFGLSYTNFSISNITLSQIVKNFTQVLSPAAPLKLTWDSFNTTVPTKAEAEFPDGFDRVPNFIYPYISNNATVGNGTYDYPSGYSTDPLPLNPAGGSSGGNPELWSVYYEVEVKVTNTGDVYGAEVPQLYIGFPQSVPDTPVKVLRGFEKIFLQPGECKAVKFQVMRRDISYWDINVQNWVIPSGEFAFLVGSSSRDIQASQNTTIFS